MRPTTPGSAFSPGPDSGSGVRLRALIVEDSPAIADFVRLGLRYEGFDVQTCADGHAAVRLLEPFRPDVVDPYLMLPGLDGLEVARRLRTVGARAVVMLTARDRLEDRIAGLEAGADDYVVKPFHFGSCWRVSGPCSGAHRAAGRGVALRRP